MARKQARQTAARSFSTTARRSGGKGISHSSASLVTGWTNPKTAAWSASRGTPLASGAAGFPGVKLRNDPCGGFEAYLAGFDGQQEAQAFATQAKARGFDVVVELN